MKNLTTLFCALIILGSCHFNETTTEPHRITNEVLESAVIYEVNIRQYSPEGTFQAFTRDIPSLKNLGVRILWLMPIHPISEVERKGTLGSYYAVQDYGKINPEFGDLDDFRELVSIAHAHGMYVILDWVANHTGWDHAWIEDHPEYYSTDAEGNITDPIDPATGESWGWTDVADLDFDNRELREKMINEMLYWVKEENIDGFRCDVAHQVPIDFWEDAVDRLRAEKPIFMLAEAEEPELLEKAFDMQYAWEGHHILNGIAQGKMNVRDLTAYLEKLENELEQDDIVMNFTSNHDENTWSGTVFDRLGEAAEVMAVTTYILPGMPLIYSGQEWDMDRRLRFFEKDTIPMIDKGEFYPLYEKLGELKNHHPALNGGKAAADYHLIPTGEDSGIFAMMRMKDDRHAVFLANLTDQSIDFSVDSSVLKPEILQLLQRTELTDRFGDGRSFHLGESHSLQPWGYQLFVD